MVRKNLRDIQSEPDHRNIAINKVGVKDISYPVVVLDRVNGTQNTVARVNMYVNLPHHFRGTHMSRFIEILNHYQSGISPHNISEILDSMKKELDAETAHFEIEFPFFITKKAQGLGFSVVSFRRVPLEVFEESDETPFHVVDLFGHVLHATAQLQRSFQGLGPVAFRVRMSDSLGYRIHRGGKQIERSRERW